VSPSDPNASSVDVPPASQPLNTGKQNLPSEIILVTGSNGFLGARVVNALLEQGQNQVRCLVRASSRLEQLHAVVQRHRAAERVEVVFGDLVDRRDCQRAASAVTTVVHLAAGFDKSFAGAFMNSALTTRNLIEAVLDVGQPKRFVNVSSFAVYSNLRLKRGALLDESCPLEDDFQERGDAYGFGKLKQEELVKQYGKSHGLPYVILRPGAIFGPGKRDLSGRIAITTFGPLLHLGGGNQIPLTYVDNCADAIVRAAITPGIDGEIMNVVDDDVLTSREVLRAYKRATGTRWSLPIPYPVAHALSALWEEYSRRTQGQLPPAFNRRRCAAEWKGNRYSNAKLKEKLGWTPRVPMDEALKRFLAQFGNHEEAKVSDKA
jgi:nucleoside-diphosphate-sugar epimerase